MSQGLRDMLANRRFAIPLIILLAFCFIGLILIGVVLIWQPGARDRGTPVAQQSATAAVEPTELATFTPAAASTATPRPSPTLVPVGTVVTSAAPEAEATLSTAQVEETQVASQQTMTAMAGEVPSAADQTATAAAMSGGEATAAPTATPGDDEELAQTGIGWGLILVSGAGLGLLAVAARRLRLANQ